jgi:hypothetical protein
MVMSIRTLRDHVTENSTRPINTGITKHSMKSTKDKTEATLRACRRSRVSSGTKAMIPHGDYHDS